MKNNDSEFVHRCKSSFIYFYLDLILSFSIFCLVVFMPSVVSTVGGLVLVAAVLIYLAGSAVMGLVRLMDGRSYF